MNKFPKRIIFCHFSSTGNKDAVEYLKIKSEKFIYLLLSFHHVPTGQTTLSFFQKSKLIAEKKYLALHPSGNLIFYLMPVIYLIHLFNILLLYFFIKEPVDVFIGQNYFCAFGGIILRRLGKVRRSIYWVGDYFPIPLTGPYRYFLKIFQVLDKLSLKYSDQVWFMTPRQMEVRRKKGSLPERKEGVYKIIPTPVSIRDLSLVRRGINFHSIVFLGVLSENQGIQETIRAVPRIIKTIPDFTFTIIGSGHFECELKRLVNKMQLEDNVVFKGFVPTEEEVQKLVSSSGAAVALYEPDKYSFTQFADSGKIKMYLSCGVPVVLTNVPYIAQEVEGYQAGIVTKFNSNELAKAIIKLLSDERVNLSYRKNAVRLAQKYSPQNVFAAVWGSS